MFNYHQLILRIELKNVYLKDKVNFQNLLEIVQKLQIAPRIVATLPYKTAKELTLVCS